MSEYYRPAGSTADGRFSVSVAPGSVDGWSWTSLRVLNLKAGESEHIQTQDEEMFVLPLAGACDVVCEGEQFSLTGRSSVFSRVSDSVYLPRDADAVVTADNGGRFALPAARCTRRLTPRYRAADDVAVEIRGTGSSTRQVNNFGSADGFEAVNLIAVEVITPAGNWSSYPPHKHDEDLPGEESLLEEIYYFEVSDGPAGPGFGLHRVYGTPDRPIDILAEVRSGDAVLVPHGWHGPSVAAPGYHLYYLNVMAGPGENREWLIRDDPAHAWVRQAWPDQAADPRLPLTSPVERSVP